MIAVDTNLLVYSHRHDSEWHDPALRIIKELAEADAPWAIPWPCLHEFLAIATHPRIYKPPTPLAKAVEQVEIWMESPSLRILGVLAGHWVELKKLVLKGRITAGAVHDARVAAICVEHGVRELWSADRDFTRMSGLVVRNPLAGKVTEPEG
jgi:toxin-antitoxin system PIN domain toxin